MSSNNLCRISTLGQVENNAINIKKTEEVVYLVDGNCKIIVSDGVAVKLVDTTDNSDIQVLGAKNSNISYTILNSKNSNRRFEINGELTINQISLFETKENLNIDLVSENASCSVSCLSIATAINNIFIQRIDHKSAMTSSNIRNVGIAMNKSNVVFDTTGFVAKGMSKSKCAQISRGIVMDDNSQITAKPILLIDEYDCFANHGASIGKMSDEDLFYLMSRGLSKKDAFLLILQGIIKPFVDNIPLDEWKEKIEVEIENMIEK